MSAAPATRAPPRHLTLGRVRQAAAELRAVRRRLAACLRAAARLRRRSAELRRVVGSAPALIRLAAGADVQDL